MTAHNGPHRNATATDGAHPCETRAFCSQDVSRYSGSGMDLFELTKKLASEWPTVMAAPSTFVTILLVGFASGWFVAWLILQQRLTHHRERIEQLQEIVAEKISAKAYKPLRIRKGRSMTLGLSLIVLGLIVAIVGAGIAISNLDRNSLKAADRAERPIMPATAATHAAGDKHIAMDRAGPVEWNPNYVLGARSGSNPDGIEIFGFQATGTNTSDEFIDRLGGFVRSEVTGQQFPILVDAGNGLVPADGFGVPAKHQFHVFARFVEKSGGISVAQFLRDFGRLTFQFEYDGKVYKRHFSPEELETEARRIETALRPRPISSVAGVRRSPSAKY